MTSCDCVSGLVPCNGHGRIGCDERCDIAYDGQLAGKWFHVCRACKGSGFITDTDEKGVRDAA